MSKKKSMPWKTTEPTILYARQFLIVALAALVLAGCAIRPWTDPLQDTERDKIARQVDALTARDGACGKTLEGDLLLFYQSPLEKKALEGFLQFSMPASYQFLITNPFGQPVLIIAGDKDSFQTINTLSKKYMMGKLQSFGLRNNIPSSFLRSDWGTLLTGRFHLSSRSIIDIRHDREARGVWLSFKDQTGVSHLLFDREKEVFSIYLLEDDQGKKIAEITYANRMAGNNCRQPLNITIAGLDYSSEIHLTLENIHISEEQKTYQLRPPPGYNRQYMP